MLLSEFDFPLPGELIAQSPAEPRDSCRLLLMDRRSGRLAHHVFRELPSLLRPGDCLVLNDTRVIPARLRGALGSDHGRAVELLLLRPMEGPLSWEALAKPARRLRAGDEVRFFGSPARARVRDRLPQGKLRVDFDGLEAPRFGAFLDRHGEMPTPPYIRRRLEDPDQYQTVFARAEGSVAAPTAGLHFTSSLLRALEARDVLVAYLLLHVGYGTFQPLRTENVEAHVMEEEYYELSAAAARRINGRRAAGGRVVAVGTSVTRTLETVYRPGMGVLPGAGRSGLFIYPGYRFGALDALLTNFHLPQSTPLLLTAAWGGWPNLAAAYRQAVALRYRFFSFGDAMLLL